MNADKITALTITRDAITEDYKQFSVHDSNSLTLASGALSDIRGYLRKVEALRLELTKPLNDHIKILNAKFHTLTAPVKVLEGVITQKMVAYRAELEAQRAEEQKQLDAEARANLTEGALIPEAIAPIVPAQNKSIPTEMGKITFVKVRRWRIKDIDAIPRDLFTLDEAEVTRLVKGGIASIAGIEIYTEEIPQARR